MLLARQITAGNCTFRIYCLQHLSSESGIDLALMIANKVLAATSLALISVPGYNASYLIE
jgi:hypothetical protein